MRSLFLCGLFALATACGAQRFAQGDEAAQLLAACGAPLRDYLTSPDPKNFPDLRSRLLVYRAAAVYFTHNEVVGSRLMYAERRPGGRRLSNAELATGLPCSTRAGLGAPLTLEAAAVGAKPPIIPQASDDTVPLLICGIVFLVAVLVIGLYVYGKNRAWTNRPVRLCLACRSIKQPLQHRNGRYYCPVCNADNPVPMDSPAAQSM